MIFLFLSLEQYSRRKQKAINVAMKRNQPLNF